MTKRKHRLLTTPTHQKHSSQQTAPRWSPATAPSTPPPRNHSNKQKATVSVDSMGRGQARRAGAGRSVGERSAAAKHVRCFLSALSSSRRLLLRCSPLPCTQNKHSRKWMTLPVGACNRLQQNTGVPTSQQPGNDFAPLLMCCYFYLYYYLPKKWCVYLFSCASPPFP